MASPSTLPGPHNLALLQLVFDSHSFDVFSLSLPGSSTSASTCSFGREAWEGLQASARMGRLPWISTEAALADGTPPCSSWQCWDEVPWDSTCPAHMELAPGSIPSTHAQMTERRARSLGNKTRKNGLMLPGTQPPGRSLSRGAPAQGHSVWEDQEPLVPEAAHSQSW